MKALHTIAFVLLVVGGLNWLLLAVFNWEIGALFDGMTALVSRVIYVLVGLSAVWLAVTHKKDCRMCAGGGMGGM
jgi:uncharacterized membrane protein YuzA (DUF378 family)